LPASSYYPRPATARDVLEMSPPVAELIDPTPVDARRAVRAAGHTTGLGPAEVGDMVYAASEAVSNGLGHGRPPVRFRLWTGPGRTAAGFTIRLIVGRPELVA
jgi:hypothetical protein